jgi:hypothetical protein
MYCPYCIYETADPLNFRRHLSTKKHAILSTQLYVGGKQDVDVAEKNVDDKMPNIRRKLKSNKAKEVKIHEGEIKILPNTIKNQTDSLFICGPRGSGKSVFAASYVSDYLYFFPDNKFYLFSNKDEDKVLDKLKPLRIKLDDKLIEKPYELKFFKNSVVLFDDIDGIANKDVKKEVFRLYDTMLKDGRSLHVTPILTYHQITDYKATREILNTVTYCVIFPKSGALSQTTYMLKNYCGLSPKQVKRIMELDSRAVVIKKTAPMAVIYTKGIYLL